MSAAARRRRCSAASGCSGPSSVKIATMTRRRRSRRSGSSSPAIAAWRSSSASPGLALVPGGERRSAAPPSRRRFRTPHASSSSRARSPPASEVGLRVVGQERPRPRRRRRARSGAARGRRPQRRGAGPASSAARSDASSPPATSWSASDGRRVSRNCSIRAGGSGARELARDLGVAKGLDGRDALDAERLGEHRVRVHVDLGELDLAAASAHRGLERGPKLAARAAPFGPEVDDHGDLARALDHPGLELGLGDVEDHIVEGNGGRRPARGLCRPGAGQRASLIMDGVDESLRGKLLIASPALVDPNFARTRSC